MKNTFIHITDEEECAKQKAGSETAWVSKWKTTTDITHCRSKSSFDYLTSFLSYFSISHSRTESASSEQSTDEGDDDSARETPADSEESETEAVEKIPAPSLGALGHEDGTCKPCAWYWRQKGCSKAEECDFCHLCDEFALKTRKHQKVRALRAAEKAERKALKAALAASAASENKRVATWADAIDN